MFLPIAGTPHREIVPLVICIFSPFIEELTSKKYFQNISDKIQTSLTN